MARSDLNVAARVRALLGDAAVVEEGTGAIPIVAPRNTEAASLLLSTAAGAGWQVSVRGRGTWMPTDAPADVAITTTRLDGVSYFNPDDLVATVDAGMPWHALCDRLAEAGMWVALDPPGKSDRSVGSVIATGGAGPLRCGYGGVRDHVLGITLVTGDGRVVRAGGIVVKNVAGFDLTKLTVGSYGAFGLLTSVTLRLRALPRADATLLAAGSPGELIGSALAVLRSGITPAALELRSPDTPGNPDWVLAVRLLGNDLEVAATSQTVIAASTTPCRTLPAEDAATFWRSATVGHVGYPLTVRLASLPASVDHMRELLIQHLGEGQMTASIGPGILRWSGAAAVDELRQARHAAAQQASPLTLERGEWSIRREFGHFGAYREGVERLVTRLRSAFDPAGVLVTALGTAP